MQSYSAGARCFLFFVWFLGLAALGATLWLPPVPSERFPAGYVALAALAAAFTGARKIYLLRTCRAGESRYVTLGFLVTFATLLALGVRAGVLVGAVSALSADLYPRRSPLHKMVFNAASLIVTAWCAGQTFAFLNGQAGHLQSRSLPAVAAAICVYFLLNTGSLACVLSLLSREPLGRTWRANFLWAFPLHLTGAAYVALALMFVNDWPMLLLAGSVAPFAFQFYKMHGDHAQQKQQLIDELETGRDALNELYLSTVKSLATAIAAKDQYTHAHIHRVQHYAVAIAERLKVSGDELEAVRTGAVLHDIGKLGVPDYVLLKPGRLSPDEQDKMKRHPVVGADILEPVRFPWPVADVVRHHHERWDGKGYPDGLAGENIPLGARILAVADVYDALTSDRPYRAAWSHHKTKEFLLCESNGHFDPRVVAAFLETVEETNAALSAMDTAAFGLDAGGAAAEGAASGASRRIGRTASELWALYEVSQTLNLAAPMQERLTLLGEKLTAILPGTTCAFLLYDVPEGTGGESGGLDGLFADASPIEAQAGAEHAVPLLRVYAVAGRHADLLRANPVMDVNSPSSVAARDGKIYRGAYSDDGLTWSLAKDARRPVRSVIVIPLIVNEETLGTMTFYHGEADAFSADDENLLLMIAEQAQTTLYQDREYDRTRSDANTDALTGLNNMRYLRHKMNLLLRAAEGRKGESLTLLYLDLDNFKNVNTFYGHPMGSRVLRDVAQLLPRELRPTDVAARYGGDEFVIILPHASEADAREVAARIRGATRRYRPTYLPAFDAACHLDVSIGIASYPQDGGSMEELVAAADRRMYQTKSAQKEIAFLPEPDAPSNAPVAPLCLDTAVVNCILQQWALARG